MGRHTKAQAQATRDHILDMAEIEFQRRGVTGTSLQDIARAAGVTRGAIYWHFKDKVDLFHAMLARVTLPLELEIRRSGEPALDDPVAHIRDSFQAALHASVADPQARRVFEIALHKVEYVEELDSLRQRRIQGHHARVRQVQRGLARALRQGALPVGMPARAAALGLHALVDGLIQNWMMDPTAFDLERVGRQAIAAYLRGLAASPSAPSATLRTAPAS
jgi:TetR/AcrR family acrAB operon transcriptional repressor